VRAALLKPDLVPAPPELLAYQAERRFAERFNVPGLPLHQWPAQKIRHYLIIMQVEEEVEAARQAQPAGGGSPPGLPARPGGASPGGGGVDAGLSARTQATEQAYQAMRAQAKPPPMPPVPPPGVALPGGQPQPGTAASPAAPTT
jgi:hypothetical protein